MYDQEIQILQTKIQELYEKMKLPNADINAIEKQIFDLESKIKYLKAKEIEYEARLAYEQAKVDLEKATKDLEEASKIGDGAIDKYKKVISESKRTSNTYTIIGLGLLASAFYFTKNKRKHY